MDNTTRTIIGILPMCDFCKTRKSIVEGKTFYGTWAYMCHTCQQVHSDCRLGLGLGQKLLQQNNRL
jgi:hypothetical protein